MSLQNRVTPFGDIVATPQRGTLTGNRGIIHDPATRTLLKRRWATKAWIVCVCDFRGRRRAVMATRSWTELFFLDEATAFAAGHRPCFYCRRQDAERFRAAWCEGQGMTRAGAAGTDAVLDGERRDGRVKRLHPLPCAVRDLPDGAMICLLSQEAGAESETAAAFVVVSGAPLRWSFDGYTPFDSRLEGAQLITPPSIVRAFAAGYRPLLHPTAA